MQVILTHKVLFSFGGGTHLATPNGGKIQEVPDGIVADPRYKALKASGKLQVVGQEPTLQAPKPTPEGEAEDGEFNLAEFNKLSVAAATKEIASGELDHALDEILENAKLAGAKKAAQARKDELSAKPTPEGEGSEESSEVNPEGENSEGGA